MERMSFRMLLTISAVVGLGVTIAFGLVPAQLFAAFGTAPLDGRMLFMARLVGALALGNTLLAWFSRDIAETRIQNAISVAFFGGSASGSLVFLLAMLPGKVNPAGWGVVVLGSSLALAYAYFYSLTRPRRVQRKAG